MERTARLRGLHNFGLVTLLVLGVAGLFPSAVFAGSLGQAGAGSQRDFESELYSQRSTSLRSDTPGCGSVLDAQDLAAVLLIEYDDNWDCPDLDLDGSGQVDRDDLPVVVHEIFNGLFETFENGTMDPRISTILAGTFNDAPGIKARTEFGSTRAFGFGLSTCSSSCFSSYQTTLRITFPSPTYVTSISFKEMELFNDWGSQGSVQLDGVTLTGSDFGSVPGNDGIPDATYREHNLTVDQTVTVIDFIVTDITNASEIFLDDLIVR